MFAQPSAGHTPVLICLGAGNAGLAGDDDDEQGDRARRLPRDADLGRCPARDRPGRAGRGRRRGDRGDRRPVVLVAAWVDPEGVDETAVRIASREATAAAIGTARGPRPAAARARRASRHRSRTPSTTGSECESAPSRRAATGSRWTRRSTPPGIPPRASTRRRRWSSCTPRRGSPATAAATRCPTGSCWSACWLVSIRCAGRWCASSARRSTSTAAGRGRARWRLGCRRAGSRGAAVAAPGRAQRAARGLRVVGRAGGSGGAGAPLPGAPRRRRARGQAPLRRRRLARRCGGRPGCAGGGRRRHDDHGRRQPGLANARRPVAALGRAAGCRRRPRPGAAGRALAGGAAAYRGRRRLRGAARGDVASDRRR